MAIQVTITPSTEQFISGIPKTVVITTDVPSMIFYTIDGSEPTTSSEVYISTLSLPTHNASAVLKVFATNGVDSSDIIVKLYSPKLTNARVSHAKAEVLDFNVFANFGSSGGPPLVLYSQPSDTPMDAAAVPNVDEDGYGSDPTKYPMRGYDQPIPVYDLLRSDSNYLGEMGKDIGTMPPQAKVIYVPPPPEESSLNKATYDPRALVTFHDGTKPNDNEDTIFRAYYNGEDLTKSMYGSALGTTAAKDGDFAPNGSLLNYHFNCKDNTVTFYYRDSRQNRWLISKEKIKSTPIPLDQRNALYNFISPPIGHNHVYKWILYKSTRVI